MSELWLNHHGHEEYADRLPQPSEIETIDFSPSNPHRAEQLGSLKPFSVSRLEQVLAGGMLAGLALGGLVVGVAGITYEGAEKVLEMSKRASVSFKRALLPNPKA